MAEKETDLGLGSILGGEESVAGPGVSLPSSPPNPVDVVLAVAGVVVVDHELDVVHIQAPAHQQLVTPGEHLILPGCHSGCDQDGEATTLEVLQDELPLPLSFITVDAVCLAKITVRRTRSSE